MILNPEKTRTTPVGYNHSRYETRRWFLRFLLKWIGFSLLVKLEKVDGLNNVPKEGPVILLMNHIAFIDPIVVLHVAPRNIVPLAKIEVYDYPFIGIIPKIWGVIPVRRRSVDRKAIRKVLDVLGAGEIVLVAPEGTRSPQLHRGKNGVAYLAGRSGAVVVPVAVEGTIGFPALRFTNRWREPGVQVRFGKPFRFRPEFKHPKGEQLQKMTEEAMFILAELLPPHRRGEYSDITKATRETILPV